MQVGVQSWRFALAKSFLGCRQIEPTTTHIVADLFFATYFNMNTKSNDEVFAPLLTFVNSGDFVTSFRVAISEQKERGGPGYMMQEACSGAIQSHQRWSSGMHPLSTSVTIGSSLPDGHVFRIRFIHCWQ